MKFLLLNVNSASLPSKGTKYVKITEAQPLGLLYIGKVLENEGHDVELVDFLAEDYYEEKLKKFLYSKDVVGISLDSYSFSEAAQIAKTIKKIDKNIILMIGGPHCSFYPEKSLIDIPEADISIEGEGEQAIKYIARALDGDKSLSEISGIKYRKNAKILSGKPKKLIDNLDSIPFPARHLVEKYEYGKLGKRYLKRQRFTSIITTRGCLNKCRFCTSHVVSMNSFRQRSVDNIINELKEINDKYKSIMIADDNFLFNKKRVHKILDKIIENRLDFDIYIHGARVDTADWDLYKKMKKAGVTTLFFGIESGNQDVLDFYNKKITLDQIKKALKISKKMGFNVEGNFIFGAPIETEKHIKNSIEFACSLPIDRVAFSSLQYRYRSDLWFEAFKSGKITKDDGFSINSDSRRGLGNFTEEELKEYCKKAIKKFYYRPTYLIRQIFKSIKMKNLNNLLILLYLRKNYINYN